LEAAVSGWPSDPNRGWAQGFPVNYQNTAVNNLPNAPETATATDIGWGYFNTRAIVLQGNSDTATSAAALADSHTVTVSGVVYDDWYLPSKDELNQMYSQRASIGGLAGSEYWTSSEFSATQAYYLVVTQYFSPFGFFGPVAGTLTTTGKSSNTLRVRPIRAF
jgi:hypothetical protein